MKRGRRKRSRTGLRTLVLFLVAVGIFLTGVFTLWAAALKIPDLGSFEERKIEQSTKIYDRTGEVLLYDVHENIQRTVIPFDEISRHIKNATVALEDAEFYRHRGIKVSAIVRAILVNLGSASFTQGGSTITQQVVKNSILTTEKKISRKLKEWVLALKLEQVLSKEDILALYLNESPYGGNIYGVEEASNAFFGKSAKNVSLTEAAYLASLPQAPTYYSPYGNNRDALEERKNLTLRRMLEDGFITEQEYEEAQEEEVEFLPQADIGIRAPHFVIFVREYLEKKYGERAVEERGFKVTTTIDIGLQQKAEEIIKRNALENEEKFNAENAALVAIDPKTGQILSMVGSRDYFDKDIDGNFNVTTAHRQPGSAFKPFVYATAFKEGYTPDTIVFDVETEFSTECSPEGKPLGSDATCYMPGNYDSVFRGPVTFRNALAQSINIPSIKVLYLAGLSDSLRTARDLGVESLDNASRYGLTLVLGGGEVSLLEMTGAYSVFANNGIRNTPVAILKIEDGSGNVVEEFKQSPSRVLDEDVALRISDVLSDNDARAPAFGEYSYLYFPGKDVAAKTGTTNDYRDAWIVGYSPSIAVGTWAGNNDNSPMEKRVAGFIVAPMWNEFMREALQVMPEEHFKSPREISTEGLSPVLRGFWQGGVGFVVDSISGKLATEYTPEETRVEKVVSGIHSTLHWIDKDDPLGDPPRKPERDPQYERWEYAVRKWVEEKGIVEGPAGTAPSEYDDVHVPKNFPKLSVSGITKNSEVASGSRVVINVSSSGTYPLSRINVYLNGTFVGSDDRAPFSVSFVPREISSVRKNNTLRVVGVDSVFNKKEEVVDFSVSF